MEWWSRHGLIERSAAAWAGQALALSPSSPLRSRRRSAWAKRDRKLQRLRHLMLVCSPLKRLTLGLIERRARNADALHAAQRNPLVTAETQRERRPREENAEKENIFSRHKGGDQL